MSKYGGVLQEGILKKKAGNDLAWNTHYAVLAADGCLRLYHSVDAARDCAKQLGRITHSQMDKVFLIPETMITYDDSEHFKFAVVSTNLGRQWQFAAPSQDEANRWVKTLNTMANATRRKASKASLSHLSRMPSVEQTTSSSGRKRVEVVEPPELSSASSLSGKDLFDDESSAFSPGRRQPSSSLVYRGHSKGKISLGRADMAKEMGNLLIEDLKEDSAELSQYALESASREMDEFDADEFRGGLHFSLRKSSASSRGGPQQFRLSSVGDPSEGERKVTERDITSLHNLGAQVPDLDSMISSIRGLDTRVSSEWVKSSYQGDLELKNESAQMLGKHTWNKHYCRLCTHALLVYSGDSDTVETKVKRNLAEKKRMVREAEDLGGKEISDQVMESESDPKTEITRVIRMDSLISCHSRVDKSTQKRFDILYYDSPSITDYLARDGDDSSLLSKLKSKSTSDLAAYSLGSMKVLSLRAESEVMRNHWVKQLVQCQRRHWQSLRDCLEMIGLFEYHLLNYTAAMDAAAKSDGNDARDGAAVSNASLMDVQAMMGMDVSSAVSSALRNGASNNHKRPPDLTVLSVSEEVRLSGSDAPIESNQSEQLPTQTTKVSTSPSERRETNNLTVLTPEELATDLSAPKTDPLASEDPTRRVKQINSRNHTVWEKETRLMFSWRFSGIQDSNAISEILNRHTNKNNQRMSVGKRASMHRPPDLMTSEDTGLISPMAMEDPTTPNFAETVFLTPGMIDTVRSSSLRSRPLSILNVDDELLSGSVRKSVVGSDSAPVLASSITIEGTAMIEFGSRKANALFIRIGNDSDDDQSEGDAGQMVDPDREDTAVSDGAGGSEEKDPSQDYSTDGDHNDSMDHTSTEPKYDKLDNTGEEEEDAGDSQSRMNTASSNQSVVFLSVSQDTLVIKRNEKDRSPLISVGLEIVKSVHRLGRDGVALTIGFQRELFGVEYYGRRSTVMTMNSPKVKNAAISDIIGVITNDDWRITLSSEKECNQWYRALNRSLKETCMVKESIYNEMYHLRSFVENLMQNDPKSDGSSSLKVSTPLGFDHINRSLSLLGQITVLMPYLLLNNASDSDGNDNSQDGLQLGIALQNSQESSNSCCACCNTCVCIIL